MTGKSTLLPRRRLLVDSAILGAAFALGGLGFAAASGAACSGRIGFQSYTARKKLAESPRDVFREAALMGYDEVELFTPFETEDGAPIPVESGLDLAGEHARIAREEGLTPVGLHIPWFFDTDDDWARWLEGDRPVRVEGYAFDKIFEVAAAQSIEYIGYPHDAPDRAYRNLREYVKHAKFLNNVGRHCRAHGLKFAFHPHGREFTPTRKGTFLDILAENTDSRNLSFELDVFWVAQAGLDPVEVLKKFGKRTSLLHLKDHKRHLPPSFNDAEVPADAFQPIGEGRLDIAGILRAVREENVAHVFVEQDETEGDAMESLRRSISHIRALAP